MASGTCTRLSELPGSLFDLLVEARRGVLTTVSDDGFPHAVPVVFLVQGNEVVSPIDDKPKSRTELVRVRNIAARPRTTFLVDRWDEDWSRLGWVMIRGTARVEGSDRYIVPFEARYRQYTPAITPGSRAIVLTPQRVSWWLWS